jgi:hypothetical protein
MIKVQNYKQKKDCKYKALVTTVESADHFGTRFSVKEQLSHLADVLECDLTPTVEGRGDGSWSKQLERVSLVTSLNAGRGNSGTEHT